VSPANDPSAVVVISTELSWAVVVSIENDPDMEPPVENVMSWSVQLSVPALAVKERAKAPMARRAERAEDVISYITYTLSGAMTRGPSIL